MLMHRKNDGTSNATKSGKEDELTLFVVGCRLPLTGIPDTESSCDDGSLADSYMKIPSSQRKF